MPRRLSKGKPVQAWGAPSTTNNVWKPVPTNIYHAIPFTWIRCLFFLVSMSLYLTDVVRSGLGIQSLTTFGMTYAGIDTYFSFGPFAYPIQTIRRVDGPHVETYVAFVEDNAGGDTEVIEEIDVWPYKFDTLSIGLRALAIELDVQEYPTCLLSVRSPCVGKSFSPKAAFAMLDGLFEATLTRLLANSCHTSFAVEHQWIDTIEQTLFGMIRDLRNVRYYSLNSYQQNATNDSAPVELMSLCSSSKPRGGEGPAMCSWFKWSTNSSLPSRDPTVASDVKVVEDIALRFARFQVENPELDMQMLILNANNLQWMFNSAAVYYDWDDQEIVVLTRGRKCDADHRHCETRVIDDYRYEREIIHTNVHEEYSVIACIRSVSQGYVWLRVTMLVMGITWSTWYETRHEPTSLPKLMLLCFVNLMKVPSHVVVYGTVFPVMLYALAHMIDSYMYHLIVQDAMTTTLGKNALLDVQNDINYVTLRMRNIWLIALFCIALVWYHTCYRHQQGWRHRHGIVGVRGIMMAFLSCSTLFFPLRFPSLRKADIRSFSLHDVHSQLDPLWALLRPEASPATTGPFLEARCLLLAISVFAILWLCAKLLSMVLRLPMPQIMDQSTIVPYSAGTLWPTFVLAGYWYTNLGYRRNHRRSVSPLLDSASLLVDKNGREILRQTPTHVRALRVEKRSNRMWALIRLMNIVAMSNPMVYVRLRYVGVPLYLYQLKSWCILSKRASGVKVMDPDVAFILPERIEVLYELNQLEHANRFELIEVINSKSLTWHELIMCG